MTGELEPKKTKGQIEAEIAEAVVGYHRSRIGRGPESIRAVLVEDLVLIRHRGSLSLAETLLAHEPGGWDLLKQTRRKLAELVRDDLVAMMERLTTRRVVDYFSDTSRSGDRVEVFVLERMTCAV